MKSCALQPSHVTQLALEQAQNAMILRKVVAMKGHQRKLLQAASGTLFLARPAISTDEGLDKEYTAVDDSSTFDWMS